MKTTKSTKDWQAFFLQMSEKEINGEVLPAQILLCCQNISMATRLAEGIPWESKEILNDDVDVIEYSDGQAAAKFPIGNRERIIQFLKFLVKGNYGTEKLVIKNGIALGLPVSDRKLLQQTLGIPQIMTIGKKEQAGQETFIWW